MNKSCCCTGYISKDFLFEYGKNALKYEAYRNLLRQKIVIAIKKYGINNFISSLTTNVDFDFAEIVLNLRDNEKYPITLECTIPCLNEQLKWYEVDISRYNYILERADRITIISRRCTDVCKLKQKRYIFDRCKLVIKITNDIINSEILHTLNHTNINSKIENIKSSSINKLEKR